MILFPRGGRPSARRAALAVTGLATVAATLTLPLAASPTATAAPAPADDIWSPVSTRLAPSLDGHDRRVNPDDYSAYTLDENGLDDVLDRAPEEGSTSSTTLSLPNPDGELVEFRIVESPIMESGLAAAHPEITTYAGEAADSAATVRLDVTPMGFHASVRQPGQASWYIDPAYNGDDSIYLSYLGADLPAEEQPLVEPDGMLDGAEHVDVDRGGVSGDQVELRTYRLALVTDQSYARYFGTENVLSEKVTLMNRVNHIYNDDLAIRMLLIDETDELNLDTDAEAVLADGPCGAAPCYQPEQLASGCTGSLLNRNRIVLGQLVGASNYDIGHIALGINGGGVAGLGVVGGDGKARGCTGLPQPEGDYMAIDYVAHEIGHQFAGNHTFNGTQWNCAGNKSSGASVEPGSGSSVMAYAGICQQDNLQPHSDPYFSQHTQAEVTAYVNSDRSLVNEVQTVSLRRFSQGDAFTLTYDGRTTAPIAFGETTYTIEAIDAAVEAILPEGGDVTVTAWSGTGALDDTGFQLRFIGEGNTLLGTDLTSFDVEPVAGDVTGFVGETAQGGPQENGGYQVDPIPNHNPNVTSPETLTIPLRTPFTLTGEATDPEDDSMVYLWEQRDRGARTGTGLVDQVKTNGPLFRIFGEYADVTPAGTLEIGSPGLNEATSDPSRTFPDMEQILANNTNATTGQCPAPPPPPESGGASNVPVPTVECFAEWLPTADYVGAVEAGNTEPSLNFRFTARDQDPAGGGYAFSDTKLLLDKAAGPFLVSSKNTPAAAKGGRTEEVRWAVAGTNTPALAENVRITLSLDGGESWEHVLAESTPNDGAEPVTWPNVATTEARIKIEAVGNVFFDVNNADFEIVPVPAPDGDAPDTTITGGPEDGSVLLATETTIGFESDDEAATFSCTVDGTVTQCDGSSLTLTDLDAGTHTVTVAAVDGSGNTDSTPATVSFTVPLDDRALAEGRGAWQRRSADGYFADTFTTTRTKRSTLATRVTDAAALHLVAATAPKFGVVKVFVGGDLVGKVRLDRARSRQRVLEIGDLAVPESGRLRLVSANGKRVKIDGLAVVTAS